LPPNIIASINIVEIEWTKPVVYAEAICTPFDKIESAYFYKILLRFGKGYKLVYIGKSNNSVAKRLTAIDHKRKIIQLKESNPRKSIEISFGHFIDYSWDNGNLVRDVEKLLIYCNYEKTELQNKKDIYSHRIKDEYLIKNISFQNRLIKGLRSTV